MSANTETFLYQFVTLAAPLRGIARVYFDDSMPSTFSQSRENTNELTPASIVHVFREMVIMYHVVDLQVFDNNCFMHIGVLLCCFEMEITPLTCDFQVRLRCTFTGFAASLTSLLASANRSLLASKRGLTLAIVARIVYGNAFAIRQEGFETDINPDIRMGTLTCHVLILDLGFAHNENIPVTISTQDQMSRFWGSFHRAVILDFDRAAQFGRKEEMFFIRSKQHVTVVLFVAIYVATGYYASDSAS